jgi:hypothetical protein
MTATAAVPGSRQAHREASERDKRARRFLLRLSLANWGIAVVAWTVSAFLGITSPASIIVYSVLFVIGLIAVVVALLTYVLEKFAHRPPDYEHADLEAGGDPGEAVTVTAATVTADVSAKGAPAISEPSAESGPVKDDAPKGAPAKSEPSATSAPVKDGAPKDDAPKGDAPSSEASAKSEPAPKGDTRRGDASKSDTAPRGDTPKSDTAAKGDTPAAPAG